jgi:hypothetical protein
MNAEGRRVEHTLPVGLVLDFPSEKAAWREVDRLGLLLRINEAPDSGRIRFNQLAEHYLKADFGQDAVRPKSEGTALNINHIVRDFLIPRFAEEIAEDIKPLAIQRWLKSLHTDKGLAWTTAAKIRGVMLRVYKTGILHALVAKNPVQPTESRSTTDYRAIIVTPEQTRAILKALPHPLHRILVLTCAATALRASELVALKPSPIHVAAAPPPPPPAPMSPEDELNAQAVKMTGDWLGAGILQNRGLCRIGLQIRPAPDKPGNYTGYSTTSCNPSLALLGHAATRENMAKDTINAMTPTSVIMTGAAEGGEIVFHISEAIGTPTNSCPMTGFKASPFGEQVAVQWQAEPCKGGRATDASPECL